MDIKTIAKKIKDRRFQRSTFVFVLCLLLSSVLWIFIHLSKNYTYSVVYHVDYTSLPDGKAFAEQPPTLITVIMNDVGFNVLTNSLSNSERRFSIDLSGLKLKHVGNYYSGFMTSDAVIKRLAITASSNIESIMPDTLSFLFSYIDSKKVPVEADISYKIMPDSDLFGNITVEPDSVTVTAVADVLRKIKSIKTENKDFGDCSSEIKASVSLVNPYPDYAKMSSGNVNITVPIFKMTEGEIVVKISDTTINGLLVKPLPSYVKVIYTMPLSQYNNVDKTIFKARLDDSSAVNANSSMSIKIVEMPEYVKVRRIEPQTAEYILLD